MVVDNDALNLLSLSFFEFVVFGVIYICGIDDCQHEVNRIYLARLIWFV